MSDLIKVATVSDLQPGEFMHVVANDVSAVLFNLDGTYYAINAKCTHRGGDLFDGELDDACIVCPLHGARFDVRTGVKERGKPDQNVASYDVQIEGENILISMA
ncbi:Rieske 2Fe-2S domain-containing protein [Dehalococcoidia bacterium]|nr:Rieske 2Fe-2S domain-containing protein [Dehalococcoidia bacterium]